MNRAVGYGLVLSTLFVSAGLVASAGCDSSPARGTGGTGGSLADAVGGGGGPGSAGAGGDTGAGGGAVAGAGGAAGSLAFTAVNPCNGAADYVTAGISIAYGGPDLTFTPKCLKVAAGSSVTFVPATSDDSFLVHPLSPSLRGTQNSPITETLAGTMATFTFPTPGFYAYYCEIHGSADDGNYMAGVIWVQ